MTLVRGAHAWWFLLPLVAGCSSQEDVRTRYELERMMWHAQFFQRRIHIAFVSSSADTRQAVEAYRRVVAADPFAHDSHADWNPGVASDIRELQVAARVALANLYFMGERYADAGTLYTETLRMGSMNFKEILDVRMGAARASYMEGDNQSVIEQCGKIFQEVQASPEFWTGKGDIDEVFLNIPAALVRLNRDHHSAAATDSSAANALAFYQRVSRTWPGGRLDSQARLAIAQVHMILEDWPAAVADLEAILSDPGQKAGDPASVELVLGEIQAFRLGNTAVAEERFRSVRERYAGSAAAHAAAYDLAALRLAEGDAASAAQDFRNLEGAPRVPDAVASRAMLARARILETSGDWDEAYALLRRLEDLYPFTNAAIEAPLVVTRHYVAAGNTLMVDVAMAHAREYYNSLLDRGSAFNGNRAMVQSALAESFIASGNAGEAARLLGSGSETWDDASTAAGMLKAAELYETVLHDPDQARTTLEKVIQRFPSTRYARTAREHLGTLAAGS